VSSGPEAPEPVVWEEEEAIDWSPDSHFQRPETLDEATEVVVGQDDLVRKLKSAFSQYTLYLDDASVQRPIVLIYGPSGSGKTFTVEALGRACDLPFTPVSSASISPPSYKGLTLRDLLIQHWKNYQTDEGVLFLDEIDKWCRGSIADGTPDSETLSNGIRTQAEVLRYVEMEKIRFLDEGRDDESGELEKITFDTGRLFWVMAGAFVGLDKIIKKRLQNVHFPEEDVWLHAQPIDFIHYGMVPELANRIATWAWVKPLTRIQIMEILRTQELPKWIKRFEALDCELELDPGALGMCANWAYEAKTGARGAAAIMRRAMDDIYYEASKHKKEYVHVDANTIRSGRLEVESASAAS
jgi:ATP-dependent Clp protease ATP-binding subunit ClpX